MDIISEIWVEYRTRKKDIRDVESEDFLDDFDLVGPVESGTGE